MAHEIEDRNGIAQFFFVGDRSAIWHELGVQCDTPPSLDDVTTTVLPDTFGPGTKYATQSLYLADGTEMPGVRANVRHFADGTSQIISHVGSHFTNYQPSEMVEWIRSFSEFLDLDTGGSLKGGSRLFLSGRIKADPVDIVPGDPVENFLMFANGYDGKLAATVGLTPIRPVCNNTLTMALESKASKLLRVKHSRQVSAAMDEIKEILDLANREFRATCEQFRSLARKQVNSSDLQAYVKKIFRVTPPKSTSMVHASPEDSLTGDDSSQGNRVYADILPLFESGKGNTMPGVKGTAWAAYNAVTEYLTHSRGRNMDNRLDSLYFGGAATMNRKALQLALEMA